jgi:hypothetical protein
MYAEIVLPQCISRNRVLEFMESNTVIEFLDIIRSPVFLFKNDVSETGLCLR